MEIVINEPPEICLEEDAEPQIIEHKTVNVYDKFIEYMHEVEDQGYRVEKVVISNELYRLMKQSTEYQNTVRYGHGNPNVYEKPEKYHEERLFGVKIEHEKFGHESIVDMLIYTRRKVIHSEMLDKTFLEDVEIEELLHHTNQRIEERDDTDR